LDNQYAARPGVPNASCLDCDVLVKHALTHTLHANILLISVFDDVACDKNGVQDENAQLIIAGELPK
jgi:hypothetical protein